MAWREIIYQYDGSFEGLMCCVYESYTQKERPAAILCAEDTDPSLFASRLVRSEAVHAERVKQSLRRISGEVLPLLQRVFLTCLPEKELKIYRFIARLYREGSTYLLCLADEDYQPLLRAARRLATEAEHYRGFLRFSVFDGILSAVIEPENRVLPLLRRHFCERCNGESFFIFDRTHREALFGTNGFSGIIPVDSYEMAPPGAEEAAFRHLWKRFYDAIAIRERVNPRLRATHMPKRYWRLMTEFQNENILPPNP